MSNTLFDDERQKRLDKRDAADFIMQRGMSNGLVYDEQRAEFTTSSLRHKYVLDDIVRCQLVMTSKVTRHSFRTLSAVTTIQIPRTNSLSSPDPPAWMRSQRLQRK